MSKTALQSQWLGGSLQIVEPEIAGNAYFVDSVNGSSSGAGTSWGTAYATIDQAINAASANSGDAIYVAPWHTESLTDNDELVMDTAGIKVVGLKQGNQRPTITLGTATSATITVSAANCGIFGLKVVSNLADVAAGITASAAADGLEVAECIFSDGASDEELVIGVSLADDCDGCKIHDNEFYTTDGGGCASAIKLVGESARTVIYNNIIFGDYSDACIDGSTAAQTIVSIRNNDMRNADSTSGAIIDLNGSSTGIVTRNLMQGSKSIADCVTAAAAMVCENYASGAAGAQGILEPAVDSDA